MENDRNEMKYVVRKISTDDLMNEVVRRMSEMSEKELLRMAIEIQIAIRSN